MGDPERRSGFSPYRAAARTPRQSGLELSRARIVPEDGRAGRRGRPGLAHVAPDGGPRALRSGRLRRMRGWPSVPRRRRRSPGGSTVPGREDSGHVLAQQLDRPRALGPAQDPPGRPRVAARRAALRGLLYSQRQRREGLRVPRGAQRAAASSQAARPASARLDHALLLVSGKNYLHKTISKCLFLFVINIIIAI